MATPLAYILYVALRQGVKTYWGSITDPYAIKAAMLTFKTTVWTIVINSIFGIVSVWCITKYAFRGNKLTSALIDLPVAVSPIIVGLVFILTFGRQSWLYAYLEKAGIQIVFATPGLSLRRFL